MLKGYSKGSQGGVRNIGSQLLGGVGRLPGTILAALLIGFFNTFFEFQSTATVGKVLVFILVIGFLQWKPAGLVALRTR